MSPPEHLTDEIKSLRDKLEAMEANGTPLDDPRILALSEAIDALVMAFYGHPRKPTPTRETS